MRLLCLIVAALICVSAVAAAEKDKDGFTPLMDGRTFDGWKIGGPKESWKIEGGAFVANGKPSHLFFVADEKPFKNFELKVDVMTEKNSNGGIYFHTKFQESDWPKAGFETQVNNTFERDPRKTGSLYSVKDVMHDSPAKDNEWWEQHIIVKDNKVTVKIDGKAVMEYTEDPGRKAGKDFSRKLDQGTFALQAHDDGSTVRYKNIRVKRLD